MWSSSQQHAAGSSSKCAVPAVLAIEDVLRYAVTNRTQRRPGKTASAG